jgi:hypothetical protein
MGAVMVSGAPYGLRTKGKGRVAEFGLNWKTKNRQNETKIKVPINGIADKS